MPNGEQQRCLRRYAGSCRYVFNRALALQRAQHELGGGFIRYLAMAKQLTAWLAEAPVHPLQQKLKDLERAYQNFFAKRSQFPRFKRKGQGDSFRYPDNKQFKVDQAHSRIFLPKLGWIRYRNSREIVGTPREPDDQPVGRFLVRQCPVPYRGREADPHRHQRHWDRRWNRSLRHLQPGRFYRPS